MKRGFFHMALLLLLACTLQAQRDTRFNTDLGLVQNYEGFFQLFDGVMSLGAGYNRSLTENLYGGADFHISFLRRKNTPGRTTIYQPSFILNYNIHLSRSLVLTPQAKLGYAILRITNSEFDYKETQSGWNPGGELRLQWKRENRLDFYLFGRFDYIRLLQDESFTRLDQYRQLYLSAFGLGVHIKSAGK